MLRKSLAVAVILLFIGVALVPSINSNVVKDELVGITTEFCGIIGTEPNMVKITEKKYVEIGEYINEFKEKIISAKSSEEKVDIFNEAIVKLDTFGLFGDLNVEEVQNLVTGRYLNFKELPVFDERYVPSFEKLDVNSNIFCLVTGETTQTFFQPISWALRFLLLLPVAIMFIPLMFLIRVGLLPGGIFAGLFFLLYEHLLQSLVNFLERENFIGASMWMINSVGWLHTDGRYGNNTFNGTFYGNLQYFSPIKHFFSDIIHGFSSTIKGRPDFYDTGQSAIGFTGFKIYTDDETKKAFYLGNALLISTR